MNFIWCSYRYSSNILPVIFLSVYLLFGKSILNKVRLFEQEVLVDKSLGKEPFKLIKLISTGNVVLTWEEMYTLIKYHITSPKLVWYNLYSYYI